MTLNKLSEWLLYPVQFPLIEPSGAISMASSPWAQRQVFSYNRRFLPSSVPPSHKGAWNIQIQYSRKRQITYTVENSMPKIKSWLTRGCCCKWLCKFLALFEFWKWFWLSVCVLSPWTNQLLVAIICRLELQTNWGWHPAPRGSRTDPRWFRTDLRHIHFLKWIQWRNKSSQIRPFFNLANWP